MLRKHITRRQFTASGMALATGLASAAPAAPAPLVIWFTVEGAKGMRRVAEAFSAATGVPVVVETPDDGPSKFQQAASAGKGPDIYIYTHDRIGEWVAGGLLHAVTPGRALREDIDALAWDGFAWRGRSWGYPYAIEAVTLLYNKALVARPPASFDEVFELDAQLSRQGRKAMLWDYTNAYFSWPLFSAHGGYAFKRRVDGSYDARDTGLGSPGALKGAELLARMIREGLMPAGIGYAEMEAALAQGRVAMMINGPWAWVNLQRAGIDFGVARIPMVEGRAAAPYVGVKGVMINRATRQRELAVEFIEHYLLTPEGLRLVNQAEPIGAPASRRFYAELLADPRLGPRIAGIMASAKDGMPTPCIPEMGRFWAAMKSSLTNLSEGRQTPAEAMAAAVRRIREGT
ncbi:maltose/maltodextrin ABC transporter substrate-binding protein MalE [Paucibacter sediminis]|uniref:Maltodextrin-binding protein n=1 Tax=Paucibacter sediminis TaxID=3019553 RepID=A0AA95NCX8_9BURK|nr:maltose/maltodextrin ABC transporter substrate-binding protein MalE [Paucibacter sp. S2-9]WIT10517.1 maltose/maltodextrin ABC transporter substrate-binding protein MalE [Paucibacter sp. S2-9]